MCQPVRLAGANLNRQPSPASSGHKNARCMYVPISTVKLNSVLTGGCGGSSSRYYSYPETCASALHVRQTSSLGNERKWTHWEIAHLLHLRFEEQLILECVHERKGFRHGTGILEGRDKPQRRSANKLPEQDGRDRSGVLGDRRCYQQIELHFHRRLIVGVGGGPGKLRQVRLPLSQPVLLHGSN